MSSKLVDNGHNDGDNDGDDDKRMEVDDEVQGEDNGDIATSPKDAQLPGQLVSSIWASLKKLSRASLCMRDA